MYVIIVTGSNGSGTFADNPYCYGPFPTMERAEAWLKGNLSGYDCIVSKLIAP